MATTGIAAIATVPTASASRYLQQLCKHWQHNLAVSFTDDHGEVIFPHDARGASWAGDARVTFDATAESLLIRVDASEARQLEALKDAVERHVDRFAFREAPLGYVWEPAAIA